MPILIGLLILAALFIVGIWLTFSVVGLLVTLVVAAVVGWLADKIVPGKLPYGWLGAIVAGLGGSWLGSAVMGSFGPVIARIPIIPAILGAIVLAFAAEFIGKSLARRRGNVYA
jgi:uncharacterized membrane protein YeaQ/YmgE (transglycosylase-associated protein family)